MRPRYTPFADRFDFYEDEAAGHEFTDAMKEKMTRWLDRHLVQTPIRVERRDKK